MESAAQLLDQSAERADSQRFNEHVPARVIDRFALIQPRRQRDHRRRERRVHAYLIEVVGLGGGLARTIGASVRQGAQSLLGCRYRLALFLPIEPFVHRHSVKDDGPILDDMNDYKLLGPIRRLQIQREALVIGVRPERVYRTGPLVSVDSVALSAQGLVANIDSGWVLDVHHVAHPANRSPNFDRLLSIGFTAHYEAMEARFGDAPVGSAGENIVVATDQFVTAEDIAGGLMIERPDRRIELKGAAVAEPCVPFTRFLLKDATADLDIVKPHRDFLRKGMRGYVMGLANLDDVVAIDVGDLVYARN